MPSSKMENDVPCLGRLRRNIVLIYNSEVEKNYHFYGIKSNHISLQFVTRCIIKYILGSVIFMGSKV